MKQVIPILLFVLLAGQAAISQSASPNMPVTQGEGLSKADQVIVQLRPGVSLDRFLAEANASCAAANGIAAVKTLAERFEIYLVSASQIFDREAFMLFLKNSPAVISASWNTPVSFRDSIPSDELYSAQWSIERIGAPKVWDVSTGGTTFHGHEIVVAVLDKGFDLIHPDLAANYWVNPGETPNDGLDNDGNGFVDDLRGWNFRQNSPIFSVERHGTSVNGIIGAIGNNGIGTAGINWKVKIMPLAIEYPDEVVAAFNYVLEMRELYNETNGEQGAFVVVTNGSFGLDGVRCDDQPTWGAMYDPLGVAGVLSVAATANEDWNVDEVGDIPTTCESEFMIAVTNTDRDDNRVAGAAYGPVHIDLGAPGQGTATTDTGASYRENFSGTSSACPHVAGAIALLYSLPCAKIDSLAFENPVEAARLMREAILQNTAPVSSLADETVSGGRLDVFEAMKYLHAYCIATQPELEGGDFKEKYLGGKGLVSVRPNPVTDELFVDYSHLDFKPVRLRMYNALGQEMILEENTFPAAFEAQTIKLDVSYLSSGFYVVNLFDLSRKISFKFIKI